MVEIAVVIDYIECTVLHRPVYKVLRELQELFALGGWQEIKSGMHGYTRMAIVFKTGRVLWNPERQDMGVHVILPASAIQLIGGDPIAMICDLDCMGGRFSRLDFAMDDMTGMLNMERIGQHAERDEYVSPSREWRDIKSSGGGRTVYFGKRGSNTLIRIYDKAAEQKQPGHWIRVEMELRKERAEAAAREVLEHWRSADYPQMVAGWLFKALDFKVASSSQKQKSRWVTCAWWREFLGSVTKVRLFVSKVVSSLDSIVGWLTHQAAPSLYLVRKKLGSDFLDSLIKDGGLRLKPIHQSLLAMPA